MQGGFSRQHGSTLGSDRDWRQHWVGQRRLGNKQIADYVSLGDCRGRVSLLLGRVASKRRPSQRAPAGEPPEARRLML